MIKILIVTDSFYPEQSPRSFRVTELAKEFFRQGNEVTVMAPYRSGIEKFLEDYPLQYKSLGVLKWKIFNFENPGVLGKLYNRAVNRILPFFFEYPKIELFFKVRRALKNEKNKYDLLISVAVPYPIHWGVAGAWNKESRMAKIWVADCGDPYFLQENDSFRPPFYFKYIEKWFMRKADYISIPVESARRAYFKEFHHKIRIIPQGFKFEDVQKRKKISDGVIRFAYGGGFIPGRRDPRELLNFLIQLSSDYTFEFHIFTPTRHLVDSYASRDKRIIVYDPVERLKFLKIISQFEFVVNFSNKGAAQVPSKLIDYAILDLPILNIETGNLDTRNVLAFLSGDYSNRYIVENPDQYKIENVAKKFLILVN